MAIAAALPFSQAAWDVSAVHTDDAYCRRGYGKSVVSFVAAHILQEGRVATCATLDRNLPMIRTAQSVGFVEVPAAQAEDIEAQQRAYFKAIEAK